MNHTLSLYDFCNNDIRVIEIDGEPWFPAKDVCDVLGLENPSQILIDSCNPANTAHMLKSNLRSTDVSFPNRGMKCVNEAGLYELILASRKPEAQAFKHWVTSVILPAIRKDGSYVAGEELVGPVPFLCRPKCSFRPLSVRKRPGFSNPVLSAVVADCRIR